NCANRVRSVTTCVCGLATDVTLAWADVSRLGGTNILAGFFGFSVSSGEPAQAGVVESQLPVRWGDQVPGIAVSVRRTKSASASLENRERRPMSAPPSFGFDAD